ncbi:Oidioi.mRNA.OKI2018_I69.XSR.g14622.t1.cds [Oikopleura dioica]|uniref:Oidioi.mRNA.OKI2018_I69.XSR.g14622.t1.cds n=1 Tax=Oikopleura dioica TaxID=34765 RepID=A0ABN7SAF0_OIKDI|nr:Oidioi.mRNA.OKI2018_I69.XSR.g14622.t1.cds [Oikopleura dioica]
MAENAKVELLKQVIQDKNDQIARLEEAVRKLKRITRDQSMQIDRQQKTVTAIRMLVEPGKGSVAFAKHDYEASESGEISFSKGQRIMLLEKPDAEGWARGRTEDGSEAIFPIDFLDIVTL